MKEKADWIGVFMTPSAYFLFNKEGSEHWFEYIPPLINDLAYKTYSAIWFDIKEIDTYLIEIKKDFILLAPIVPEVVKKFTNTIEYLKIISNNDLGKAT